MKQNNRNYRRGKLNNSYKARRQTITLLVGLMFIFFLISFTSAFEFDNIKSYDKIEKKITIYNWNVIGKIFNIKLAEYKLIYNTNQCLTNCHAEGLAILHSKGQLFSEMIFKDREDKLVNLISNKILLEHSEEYEEQVVDEKLTKIICKNVYNEINKTEVEVCTTNTIYKTIIKERKVWKEYNFEVLEEGEYKWRIEGKKKIKESVDWVGSAFGEEFTEWAWWNNDWLKCRNMNITGGSADLTDFPFYVNVTYDSDMQVDFDDIRFVNGSCRNDGSEMDYEIDYKTNSNSAGVWVKAPTLTTGVNQYSMYYDNDAVGSGEDALSVWVDYMAVYHFSEGSGTIIDSTGRHNSSSTAGIDASNWIVGQFGLGLHFNGINELVTIDDAVTLRATTNLTYGGWVRVEGNQSSAQGYVMSKRNNDADMDYELQITRPADYYNGLIFDNSGGIDQLVSGEGTMVIDLWKLVNYRITDSNFLVYLNNSFINNIIIVAGLDTSTSPLLFGSRSPTPFNAWFNGTMDEIRISNVSRSDNWISRTYDNIDMSKFTFGEEETRMKVSTTLNLPIDNANFSVDYVNFSVTSTPTATTLINVTRYIWHDTGVEFIRNTTALSGTDAITTTWNNTIIPDGDFIWNALAFATPNTSDWGTNRTFTIDTTPDIHFINPTPTTNTNISVRSFVVNVSLTETYFNNLTFNLYNTSGLYDSTTFIDTTRQLNWSGIADGTYTYNATIETTTSQSNSTATRTINIDVSPPTINITSPTDFINFHAFGNNLSLNWSISDTHLDSCWLDYNSVNTSLTCGANNFSFTPMINKQSLIVWANDTFGNVNYGTTSWTYNFVENNATFNKTSYETTAESFILNLTTDLTVLSIDSILNYNGTDYISTAECSGGECLLSNNIDLPLISSATTKSHNFYWNFTIFNGTDSITTTSSIRIQNVSAIFLEQCNTTYVTKTLNFTTYDEQNLSRLSQFQFDGTFDFWIGSGTVKKNKSLSKNISEINLCLVPNVTMKIDATIDYDEVGNTTDYTNRFYYFDSFQINNTIQHINMYLLKSTSSTSFILKVQDENLLPVADALIEIHRYYPGEGIYRIVQIAKTDDNGKSIGFFETETVDYKFIIKSNGNTLLETDKQKVVPEISPYTLTFNTGSDLGEPWSSQAEIPNLESSLSWDADTGFVTYTYVDSSETFTQTRLFVQEQSLGNSTAYTLICNDTSSLSSSTMTCNVGNESGFYVASVYITRTGESLDLQITFQIETFSSVVGLIGLFFGWFLILISSFMFKFNEIAGIWAMTITIFLVNIMGLIKFGSVFVTAIFGIALILTWVMERP